MTDPSTEGQHQVVLAFRVAGVVLTGIAAVLLVTGFVSFAGAGSSDDVPADFPPTGFYLFVAGMPFLAAGAFCLRAGFFGAAARFVARESTPALRQLKDDLWPAPTPGSGRYCGSCGAQRGATDRFCPGCGTPVAGP